MEKYLAKRASIVNEEKKVEDLLEPQQNVFPSRASKKWNVKLFQNSQWTFEQTDFLSFTGRRNNF